ncbi:hypothetical protein GPECTOR_4g586 [Gonium pectorale]|uniref:tRNA (guanine(9)-N(1))-methyltransferase n=1 Tax=Gonium pectorale TaxID=33097 RepID=A0A150GXH3_GONPE|nr:hypothetical protein GPECTOR_4g586 [Gonium pectorale]|eukprot:KXZ54521.1 hypothetical protein GPECTOR_4g586 [Gonium pectorale]
MQPNQRGAEADDEIGLALREAARRRAKLAAALAGGEGVLRVVIDCGFVHTLQIQTLLKAQLRSLAKQVQSAVGHNRRAEQPACLQVASWSGDLAAYADERMGAASWPLVKHARPILELFDPRDIVVLSPDAEQPLLDLDLGRVYVIGGIVDRSIIRGVTAGFAAEHGLETRRLPTIELAEQLGLGPGVSKRPVLNICDVVAAMLRFRSNGGDWADALDAAIPRRKRTAAAAPRQTAAAAASAASAAVSGGSR